MPPRLRAAIPGLLMLAIGLVFVVVLHDGQIPLLARRPTGIVLIVLGGLELAGVLMGGDRSPRGRGTR